MLPLCLKVFNCTNMRHIGMENFDLFVDAFLSSEFRNEI